MWRTDEVPTSSGNSMPPRTLYVRGGLRSTGDMGAVTLGNRPRPGTGGFRNGGEMNSNQSQAQAARHTVSGT